MASSPAAMLANVLQRLRSVEESQTRSMAVVNKLRLDMENVASRIHELDFSHKSALREINILLQRFGEQMTISRRKEQEKVRLAFLHLREEMDEERNAFSLLKMQNKKLTKDLTHANVAAADACEELDRERKARGLLEEVCNELAREIGEDKAEVEQLKQEQEESRERLEEQMKMLRMAALWREERMSSRRCETELRLVDHGKQGMPVHELRSKLEDRVSTVGGTSDGTECSQEEIEKQTEQTKLLTQALQVLELKEARQSPSTAADGGSAARVGRGPASSDLCFVEKRSSESEKQLYEDRGNLLHGHKHTLNGIEPKMSINETRKPRKGRRRQRTSGHNVGNKTWPETHCEILAWPSSEDEPGKRQSITLKSYMPHWKGGHVFEGDTNDHNLHMAEMRPSVYTASSEHTKRKESCHLDQRLCNAMGTGGSHKEHSLSARFEVGADGELDPKLKADMRPSIRCSFSEDDAPSYIGSHGRRRKQEGKEEQASHNAINDDGHHRHYNHNYVDIYKSTGRVEAGAEDSQLENIYFESVRGLNNAFNNNIDCKANGDEHVGDSEARPERDFSNCSDEAQCGNAAKFSQGCKDSRESFLKNDAERITLLDSQQSNIVGCANSGSQENMNKVSAWRSASTKPRPCFWPPSPDTFSIFSGAKKRSKAFSSTPASAADDEQFMNSRHPHAQRQASLAKDATHQQHLVCMKSDSLGAQLIKAREPEIEKRAKSSFRFSPLRRAVSNG